VGSPQLLFDYNPDTDQFHAPQSQPDWLPNQANPVTVQATAQLTGNNQPPTQLTGQLGGLLYAQATDHIGDPDPTTGTRIIVQDAFDVFLDSGLGDYVALQGRPELVFLVGGPGADDLEFSDAQGIGRAVLIGGRAQLAGGRDARIRVPPC
jgi:hypothetical protein